MGYVSSGTLGWFLPCQWCTWDCVSLRNYTAGLHRVTLVLHVMVDEYLSALADAGGEEGPGWGRGSQILRFLFTIMQFKQNVVAGSSSPPKKKSLPEGQTKSRKVKLLFSGRCTLYSRAASSEHCHRGHHCSKWNQSYECDFIVHLLDLDPLTNILGHFRLNI